MSSDTPSTSGESADVDAPTDDATTTTAPAPIDHPAAVGTEEEPGAASGTRRKPVVEAMAPSRSFWTRIDRPFVFGFLVTLGALAAILLGLALGNLSTVIIYIAFALFAALGLDPAVRFLERRGLSRAWAVVVTLVALIGVLITVLWTIIPVVAAQVASFVRDVPGMVNDFMASDVYNTLEAQFGDQFQTLVEDLTTFITDPGNIAAIGGGALQVGASIATGISGVIIVLVLTLYFVATLPMMKNAMLRLAPARDRGRIDEISTQITESVGGYVMGMVTLAFINAVLVFLLYTFLGLPFPLLLATVAFCITLIPLVGSVLFWVIGSVIALFTDPLSALIFAAVYIVYMQVEAYVVTPRVMNKAISIPGSLVVIGALVGGTLLGLLGALVAVPVTASILIIIKQVLIPRQDARV